ncbi:ATP-binding protein [Opitutus sp. GAS368]|uniref:sensor histidine kinase n=1 Tax=Opitutus sp. GAS368 TaxID=1882749 RepID=UPI00087AE5E3|nr:ATP-binding protein [Opitutus sp. GAS368]SDR89356.1 two-component system, OmpR family, heavy metal sensor histidine kinase CusS [Opitutus sp. GAS368]
MKSVGVRLAFWYALASVLTLALLFRAGRYLLEQHVIRSLDLLNATQFEQVKEHFGPDPGALTPAEIRERMRDGNEPAYARFYIELHQPGDGAVYSSRNLGRRSIPRVAFKPDFSANFFAAVFSYRNSDSRLVPAKRTFNVMLDDLGELRVGEFALGPLSVLIATPKVQVAETIKGYDEISGVLLVFMLLASAGIGYGLSRVALRPVRLIQETANHISSDNLSERIPVAPVEDEISDLARLLNQMFDRLESSFNQVRRFTAEASHELKTPLSLMRLQSEKMLMDGGLNPAQEESLHIVLEEINRLNTIIEELLFLSRAEADAITLDRRPQDPRVFMENFAQDARVLADSRGVRLADIHGGEGRVEFDARWLRQVLLNLLANALSYTPAGKCVTVTSQLGTTGWRVAVDDEGPGVPADQRERIFERFVRLAHPAQHDKGSGLGLAISRSIITLHQGRIWAEAPASGKGLRVVFELPLAGADGGPAIPRPN